jgi:transposase
MTWWRTDVIMRALDPEVVDAIWAAIEPLIPPPPRTHPLGCHRPRVPDRLCFRGILLRLVTGASWVDIEAILDHQVSDTTLRARRDEWIDAGVFEQVKTEALGAFDRIVGPRLGRHRSRRDRFRAAGIDQFEIQRRGTKLPGVKRQPLRLGLRWVVEGNQHVVVELRAAATQHRPTSPPPPRRPLPRHRHPHRRPPHRLAQPMESQMSTYPLRS